MTLTDPKHLSFPCSECQAGQLRYKLVTYYTWLGNEIITVPDFPAWVCDVCGRREYDHQALNRMSLLLNTHTKNPKHTGKQAPRTSRGDKPLPNP